MCGGTIQNWTRPLAGQCGQLLRVTLQDGMTARVDMGQSSFCRKSKQAIARFDRLRRQRMELLCGSQLVSSLYAHLFFLDHAHQVNSGQCFLCRVKTLESQHRVTFAFERAVILFDDVVEILVLTNLDALAVIVIAGVDRGRIRTALVDIDEARFATPINRPGQKPQRGVLLTLGRE
jgi:hypothetical protein